MNNKRNVGIFFLKTLYSGITRCCLPQSPLYPVSTSPNLSLRRIFFQKKTDKIAHPYTIQEFENIAKVNYVPTLCAENEATFCLAMRHCQRLEKQDNFLYKKTRWYGAYYHREIANAHVAPLYIRWTGKIKGWGAFARDSLPADSFIGEYTGQLFLVSCFFNSINPYSFHYPLPLSQWLWFTIDAQKYGNETRFINHSEHPNCTSRVVYSHGLLRVVLCAKRAIASHEELTYNYGDTLWGDKRSF